MLLFLFFFIGAFQTTHAPATEITDQSFDSVLAGYKFSMVNFYVNWCMFCRRLEPIYDQVAEEVNKSFKNAIITKINCEENSQMSAKYSVNKFPTLMLFKFGKTMQREYMGDRTVQALVDFVRNHMDTEPKVVANENVINFEHSTVIGYFSSELSPLYQRFRMLSEEFHEDCSFYAIFRRELFQNFSEHYFVSQHSPEKKEKYPKDSNDDAALQSWIEELCRPLIREITYKNAEQITNMAKPLIILFCHYNDSESLSLFREAVLKHRNAIEGKLKPVFANAAHFHHPLHHLGLTPSDAPIIVVDDFRHMYHFPTFLDIKDDQKFAQFLKDFHSDELHRQLHRKLERQVFNIPNIVIISSAHNAHFGSMDNPSSLQQDPVQKQQANNDNQQPHKTIVDKQPLNEQGQHKSAIPVVESVFKNLAPNKDRYTLLTYDEL